MAADHENFGEYSDKKQIYSILNIINQQRQDSKLCDVTLRISNTHIYAHSNVLAAASPYFDALFSGQDLPRIFSQKSPQIIEIHIDGPTDPGYSTAVQKVVDFMYTSRIRLEHAILTQVMEIAKIMQMTNIIEFCEMFQQGFDSTCSLSFARDGTQQPCRDVLVQTDSDFKTEEELKKNNEYEVFVFNRSGVNSTESDETWKFSKNFKQKLKQSLIQSGKHRGRGRPRKNQLNNKPSNVNVTTSDTDKGENEEKENVDKNFEAAYNDNTESVDKGDDSDKSNTAIDVHAKVNVISKADDQPLRVSKRGRIIKPKVFSDEIISSIKKEVLSDSDSDHEPSESLPTDIQPLGEEFSISVDPLENIRRVKIENSLGLYPCEQCEYKTHDIKEFSDHRRAHLHDAKMCSYCGWVYDPEITSEDFDEHLQKHSGPLPFFCTICSARFKTRTKLFLHLPKHSKNKPFVCDICKAGFKWKHALKNHMNVHKTTKDYLCDICGFSTAHKTQLKAHHLIHTGNTFKCTEPGCNYQSTKKANVKFHMMTHTREKPHQCDVCGTSFSLFKNMKRHMLLHTNDRPYRCENCTFSTTRFDKLKEHYFKQHNIGEKPAKKFRLSEYIKMQESDELESTDNVNEEIIKTDAEELNLTEDMETIELQVAEEENGAATTQILNLTSATGEAIPIAITQIGADISYEIQQFPIQFVTQEIVTDG